MALCRKPFTKGGASPPKIRIVFTSTVPPECRRRRVRWSAGAACGGSLVQIDSNHNCWSRIFTHSPPVDAAKRGGGARAQAKSLIFARDALRPIQLNSADHEFERFLMQIVARYSPFRSTNVFAVLPNR